VLTAALACAYNPNRVKVDANGVVIGACGDPVWCTGLEAESVLASLSQAVLTMMRDKTGRHTVLGSNGLQQS
jgi:hypothetical protein